MSEKEKCKDYGQSIKVKHHDSNCNISCECNNMFNTNSMIDVNMHCSSDSEKVDHPSYYNTGIIEPIDAIHDWRLGFNLGNAIKYISRAGKKDIEATNQDLEKAIWYIKDHISRTKEGNNG